jgi:hypothetical protein
VTPPSLTPDVVADQASSILVNFPMISQRIDRPKILASLTAAWPSPPAPMIYWLWVASNADFAGSPRAKAYLQSLEMMLTLLGYNQPVGGSWQRRMRKLYPGGRSPDDHLTEFRATLFEFLLSFQLLGEEIGINFEREHGAVGCDMTVISKGNRIAAVEAYAPQKDISEWYEKSVVAPWRSLIGEPGGTPQQETVKDISLDVGAISRSLSNILTDGNFSKRKAQQLASGDVPTLLAIRAYSLTPRLETLIATPSAEILAGQITQDAWSRLPAQCVGLLFCFTSDILGDWGPILFLLAPGRVLPENLKEYLAYKGYLSAAGQ